MTKFVTCVIYNSFIGDDFGEEVWRLSQETIDCIYGEKWLQTLNFDFNHTSDLSELLFSTLHSSFSNESITFPIEDIHKSYLSKNWSWEVSGSDLEKDYLLPTIKYHVNNLNHSYGLVRIPAVVLVL